MAAANYAIDLNFPPQSDAVTHGTLPVNDVLRIGLGFSGFCGVLTLGLLLMRLRNYYYGIGVRKGQLTLAVLLVDSRGHIMVDSEGHLPTRAVLGNFDFDPARPMAHPALLWLLKTSGAWDKINHLAYAFRKHGGRVYRLLQDVLVDRPDGELANRRMPFYRLALVHEIVTLSTFMGIPFDRMGLMYDTVLEARDGWVGLIVDHLDSCRAGELAARGFRWTSQKHVITILSRHLRVSTGALRPIILDVPDYVSTRTKPLKSGLHAGVLLVHPKIGNFQIMVPSRDRSTIPEVELSPIAFGALKDNARRLTAYLAPILTGGGGESMVMADYVAASEILSALTRMGIGMDPASALPLESLTPPESVLVLHRKTKPMDAPGDSPKLNPPKNGREEYPWVSRVPFGSWFPSPNSGDVDMLLFIRLHSAVGGKFTPPAGFTLVDLTVFEAMHYARCFPARLRRILGLEMNADLDEMIVPTPLGLLDSGDSKRTSAQKVPISNLWRDSVGSKLSTTEGTTSRTLSEDKHGHVVLNVDDILREGPPEDIVSRTAIPHSGSKGTLVNPPESTRLSLARRMSLHKLKKALGFADRNCKDNGHYVPDLSVDATPLAEFRPHSEPSGALSDDDEPIPEALGPEASPAANAWQAVRWVKLYINADWRYMLNAGTKSNVNNGIGGFLFGGANWSKLSINGEDGSGVSRSNSATRKELERA
ncbi:hypothetical protein SpCBS45565_g04567 [Spizellomyces sp. 'palustris']|nr:hypothetical protein SpCBS45565_g04567 [Spizellomyces sp. 'palustris']